MLALIGSILGLLGSLAPEILKYFKIKQDHKHEIEMAKLQMEAYKQIHEARLEEINAQADIEESKALYEHSTPQLTGVKVVDALVSLYNSSVRPTVTYAFIALYMWVKYSVIYGLIKAGWNWQQVGEKVWNSEDFAILSTIIGFWFGSRMVRYALQRMDNIPGKIK